MTLRALDTTKGSFFHWAFRTPKPCEELHWWSSRILPYLIMATLFGIVPISIAMITQPVWWNRQQDFSLPVFRDYSVICMTLLTLPLITVLLLTEKNRMPRWINAVRESGILRYRNEEGFDKWRSVWEIRFRSINIWTQIGGVVFGVAEGWYNYHSWMANPAVGGWLMTQNHEILLPGWIFVCWLVPVLCCMCVVYSVRGIGTVFLLRDLVKMSDVRPQPLHPDNAGGLSLVGRIGLRNQYVLAAGGINLVCAAVVARQLVHFDPTQATFQFGSLALVTLFYLIAGPIAFTGPLLPFRKSMLEEKNRLLNSIAESLKRKMDEIDVQLGKKDAPAKHLDEEIDRLNKLKELVKGCPVWPFDTVTLRHFLTAYLAPVVTALSALSPIGEKIFPELAKLFSG